MNVEVAPAGTVVYWVVVVLLAMVAVAATAVTLRLPRRFLVITAAGALAVALVLVCLPHDAPPPPVGVLLGILALGLAVAGGGPAVQFVLAVASRGSRVEQGEHGGIVVTPRRANPDRESREVLRGGTVIGLFERFGTAAAILAGHPEAVALIVAIKGVGRFSELDASEAQERFLVGTLVSLTWSAACGALAVLALH